MTPATEDTIARIVGAAAGLAPVPGAAELGTSVAHMLLRVLNGEPVDAVVQSPAARAVGVDIEALKASLLAASG